MTDLPFTLPAPDATRPERQPAKCRRHDNRTWLPETDEWECQRCGHRAAVAVTRRGRSSDRLGKDQERRIERVYGPRKVGEYGDAVDHLGRDFKWQAKASRSLPPRWLAAITEPTHRDILPRSILEPMAHMRPIGGARSPLLIRSYVRQGVPTQDWMFVTSWDWGELHGWPTILGYAVIPGASFLDIHGRDEELR